MSDPTRPVTGYPAPNQNPNHNNFSQPPPVTAYPYVAPPPPQPYPYYSTTNPHRSTFLRRFVTILFATIILIGTIIFIIWLVLRPRLPQFRVETFSLTSPFNLTPSRLSTSWDLALTARNPNSKITLIYDDVEAAVFYRGKSLANTYLAPFVQGKKNESLIKASFVAASTFVDEGVVEGINEEKGKGGRVGFNVRIVAAVRFKAGVWRARRRLLKVYCGGLVVAMEGNGTTTSGARQCSVGM